MLKARSAASECDGEFGDVLSPLVHHYACSRPVPIMFRRKVVKKKAQLGLGPHLSFLVAQYLPAVQYRISGIFNKRERRVPSPASPRILWISICQAGTQQLSSRERNPVLCHDQRIGNLPVLHGRNKNPHQSP
jgi:hypothetical protein